MPAVTWKSLTLAGFGCYRQRVTVTFQEGLNVLVAPNEKGKSTLVAGLEAVLFGLPNTGNPEAFGSARFASWGEADRAEGEVEFRVDGRAYAIRRLFATNRVTLRAGDDNGWQEIWGGTHNPGAHRKIPVYIEHLATFLGITSRELFEATFCLGQPLPEGRALSGEVQKLLSGSGGHYLEALERLALDLKELTRYCGDLGVGNNGRKDARLEELRAEIEKYRQQQQATGATIDRLTAVRSRLQELGGALQDVEGQLKKQRGLLAAWDRWRALQVKYSSALREQQTIEADREAARELDGKIRRRREEAGRLYPEWAAAPGDAPARLDRLVQLEQEISRYREELAAREEHLEQLDRQRGELAARLEGELQAAAAHPDILRDLEDLDNLAGEQERLAGQLRELAAREEAAAAGLAALPDFRLLGGSPATALEGLRVTARQLQENWERFQEQQRRCQELEEELAGELSCFAGLPPEKEALVADYAANRLARERAEEAARAALRRVEEQHDNYRRRLEEFERDFGDLKDLGEEALQAAADKPRLLAELQAREAAGRAAREAGSSRKRKVVAALAGAGLVAGLATGLASGNWLLALGIFLALAGAGYGAGVYLGRQAEDDPRLAGAIAALEEQLAQADARLGPYAGATATELGELRQRLLVRERARAELAALAAALPGPDGEEAARRALAEASRAYRDFQEATAAVSARFSDVNAAYRRYQDARRERERLAAEMAAFTTRAVGVTPEAALAVPLADLSTPWPELASLARLAGREPATTGELLAWLKECDRATWESFLDRARRWEELAAIARQVKDRQEQLLRPDREGRTAPERLAAQIASLKEHIAPFTPADDRRVIAGLLAEAGEARERLVDLNGRYQAVAGQAASLRKQIAALAPEAEKLRQGLAPILAAAGGETGAARQRQQDYEQMAREWRDWQEQLAGLLRGGTLEDLAAACLDAANRTVAILHEWQDLCREHPGLPEPGGNAAVATLEDQYNALRASIAGLETRLAGLENEERELLRQQSRLEGDQTVNIAAVAETLAAKEKELERLELEARALALAHRELVEAAREYSQNYRQELARAASRYFVLFTGQRERQVDISEDFRVEVRENGKKVAPAQFSRGAQDQLYLSLRLAIGDLLGASVTLPFIFDDCFVNCDSERRERIRESLLALAPHRQLILLTHDPDFATWGTPVLFEK